MFKGPRLKSAPFAPFSRSFLQESVLRKAGFVKSNDSPYERNTATKTTHNEYFHVMVDSMFGNPSPKVLRLDTLRERFVIAATEKARGNCMEFAGIKSVQQDPEQPVRVIVVPQNSRERQLTFSMETPDIAKEFITKLDDILHNYRA